MKNCKQCGYNNAEVFISAVNGTVGIPVCNKCANSLMSIADIWEVSELVA